MARAFLVLLGGMVGCGGGAEPTRTAPLQFPVVAAGGAVAVSSARFLGVDPAVRLTNSQLRNCRFGRSEKIPMVPSLVEQTPEALRFQGQDVLALVGGRLPAGSGAIGPLSAVLAPFADSNQALAARSCAPWRRGADDPAQTPSLLIAMDAAAPAADLLRISQTAADAGLMRQALWVQSPAPRTLAAAALDRTPSSSAAAEALDLRWATGAWSAHTADGRVLALDAMRAQLAGAAAGAERPAVSVAVPSDLSVQALADALGALGGLGLPCASLVPGEGAGDALTKHDPGAAQQALLQQEIAVLPLFVGGAELASGERCLPGGEPPEPTLLELNPPSGP